MKTGFTFQLGHKDIFIETSAKNKTRNLARRILNRMQIPDCPAAIHEMLYHMERAILTEKTLSDGRVLYDISGCAAGSRWHISCLADNDSVVVIKL